MVAKQQAKTTPNNSIMAKMTPEQENTIKIIATWPWKSNMMYHLELLYNMSSADFFKNHVFNADLFWSNVLQRPLPKLKVLTRQ